MIRVKTFGCSLRIFHVTQELHTLDDNVNEFLEKEEIQSLFSVSDTAVTDSTGAIVGITRVIAYDDGKRTT
jgi:hypothetical protein